MNADHPPRLPPSPIGRGKGPAAEGSGKGEGDERQIRYRDGEPADVPVIDSIFRDSFAATFAHLYKPEDLAAFLARFTPEAWAAELAHPQVAIRLAEDAEGPFGFCKLGPVTLPAEPSGPAIELRQLYLLERGKGSGAAAALMDWALDTSRTRGAAELWLSVYVDNHRAKRFYARYGFEDRGPYAFMVGNHADEDRMMRVAL